MSGLISRSELLKEIEKYKFGAISNDAEREYIKKTILDFIICQPTAYSVDRVVEELREFLINYGVPENSRVHQRIIKIVKQEAEQYNNGWIPCSDRLPEEKINPITKDYYVYPVTYRNENIEDVRYYSYGNGHWHHCLQIMDDFVVAWQPLPEPFKEGNANVESN